LTVPGCGGIEPQAGQDNSAARKKSPIAFNLDRIITSLFLYLIDAMGGSEVANVD
jgi:hypothetical protein